MPYIGNIVQDFSVNTAMLNSDSVTSIKIDDGTIVNADINDSAAIAGTKISPNFGSQNVVTTGNITSSAGEISTTNGSLVANKGTNNQVILGHDGAVEISRNGGGAFIDFKNDPSEDHDARIQENNGGFDISGNVNIASGLDVTGAITGTGDMTIDTNTLHVDSSNNRVGIGTTSPSSLVHLNSSGDTQLILSSDSDTFKLSCFSNGEAGIETTGANPLRFLTNGTDRVRITSAGRLGIGTNTPSEQLETVGNIRATTNGSDDSIILNHNGSIEMTRSGGPFIDFKNASEDHDCRIKQESDGLAFTTGGSSSATEKMRITSDGVAIVAGSSPYSDGTFGQAKLQWHAKTGNHAGACCIADTNNDIDAILFKTPSGVAGTIGTNTSSIYFKSGGNSKRMTIDSAGLVGIGTESPESLVEVSGANDAVVGISLGRALGTLTSSRYIGLTQNGNANNLATNSGFQGIEFGGPGSTAEGYLALHTHDNGVASGERMRIDKSGNVGIGTSSPNTKLDVNGSTTIRVTNSTSYQSAFNVTNSVTIDLQVWIKNNAVAVGPSTASNIHFVTQGNGNTRMVVQDNGNVGIGRIGPEARLDVESPTLGGTSGNQQDLIRIKSPDVTNNTRYIFRNFRYANGTSHESSELRFFRKVDVTDMGYVGLRNQAITFGYGADEGMRMADDRTVSIGRTSSEGSQLMVDNQGNGRNSIRISQAHQTALAQFTEVSNASYAGDGFKYHLSRAASSAFNFMAFDSAHASTPDREFTIRGDGNAYADGTWNNNGADYAEFFESSTGSAIPVGTAVVLENNKVRAATSSDAVGNIIGVVRPKEPSQASMTIGNTAWNKWQGKYLTDDFDRFILDEHTVINWTDADGTFHSYESHAIPSDVTVPSDATTLTTDAKGNKFTHYRLNPAYDSSKTYVPREDRDEWVIIGLVGQVKVLKGEVVNDRWIKMRDVSDTVEEYFIR